MDIQLARTFLAVADTGSFVAASARLFVTQSAVSLRVQRLEDMLGRAVFERSKAGATMTPAGRAFEPYALSLVKLWEEARQQVAVPDGFARALSIGAQYSLWPRLGFRWIDALRADAPDLALRGELGMPDRLTRFLVEGVVQATLSYAPQARPGVTIEPVLEDELILVSARAGDTLDAPDFAARYVYADWGPEFARAHAALPGLGPGGVTLSLGALAADFVAPRGAAAYLPARAVRPRLDRGELHLVPDTPRFPSPIWAAFRDDLDPAVAALARDALARVAADAETAQERVLSELADLSAGDDVAVMGA